MAGRTAGGLVVWQGTYAKKRRQIDKGDCLLRNQELNTSRAQRRSSIDARYEPLMYVCMLSFIHSFNGAQCCACWEGEERKQQQQQIVGRNASIMHARRAWCARVQMPRAVTRGKVARISTLSVRSGHRNIPENSWSSLAFFFPTCSVVDGCSYTERSRRFVHIV